MEAKLESNVGQCGIRIAAEINKNKLAKGAEKILGYMLWHDIQSAMHSGGKKAEFNSKSAYSDALGARAQKEAVEVLSKYFDNVSIETFEYVKQSPEDKFIAWAKKLGLDEAETRAALDKAKANGEVEKPTETIE